MITTYDYSKNGHRCSICDGREPIVAYITRFYVGSKLKENQEFSYFVKPGAVTTLNGAKKEVGEAFKIIESSNEKAESKEGLIIMKGIACTCGECGCKMKATLGGGTELIGRMEGTCQEGEFFIDIIKA